MKFSSIVRARHALALIGVSTFGLVVACGDDEATATAGPAMDAGSSDALAPEADASKTMIDGGYVDPTGAVIRADRFVTKVVSFTPGPCSGFGSTSMPDIVEGPPVGAGDHAGGLDVVSLGIGGEIVVSFEPNAVVDGPGPDLLVFENAFFAGSSSEPYADLAEVSVSEDGTTWTTFPCTPGSSAPYGTCAGWHPVYSAPGNGVSPVDPATAGGDPFDLADIGVAKARFVRIRDKATATCEGQPKPTNLGFDLDAIAIVNAETP